MTATLYQMDADDFLGTLEAGSVDLIVTDPAYESLEKHRAVGTTTRLKRQWFQIYPNARYEQFFKNCFRVLKKNSHLYVFSDQETMFVMKPLAEAAGFKFWKPIVWDKCLGTGTPVYTSRGVVPVESIREGDTVARPSGGFARVRGVRTVQAPSVAIKLSDGTTVTCSMDHRFVRRDGGLVEARKLSPGDRLKESDVSTPYPVKSIDFSDVISESERVVEIPVNGCLWCGKQFPNRRGVSAHQARFCDKARSKKEMAETLGISVKTLQWWMLRGALPAPWAKDLGLLDRCSRSRMIYQEGKTRWCRDNAVLDHDLGKFVGLFAAEGIWRPNGLTFALHTLEKHLHSHIARVARSLSGAQAKVHRSSENGAAVSVYSATLKKLMEWFVSGHTAPSKTLRSMVYEAGDAFRDGVAAGLLEGDGHWEHAAHRQIFTSTSIDLALFIHRWARSKGYKSAIRRIENDHLGAWIVSYDPAQKQEPMTVVSVEDVGAATLHDISIESLDETFLLGNGLVTHNCHMGMGYHYRSRYEFILFFEKGKRKLNNLGEPDVLYHKRIRNGYPTEKPVPLIKTLVSQSSLPGERVVDPFFGSGAVAVAAKELDRRFEGSDISPDAYEYASKRLL